MSRSSILFILSCLLAVGVVCTRQPLDVAGGSTSTNNARLTGTVFDENGRMIAGAGVTLREIAMTSQGDSVTAEWHRTAGSSGDYAFDTVPTGDYVLLARDVEVGNADYQTKCEIRTDTTVPLTLAKLYVLKGRICADSSINKQDFVVAAAGLTTPVHPDAQGFYTLMGVPRGQYDIGFIHGTTVDYLPLQTLSCGSCTSDTLYVRDISYSSYNTMPYSYYGTTLSAAYAVQPVVYAAGSEPLWYSGKDFSYVRYFTISGSALHEINGEGIPSLLLDDFDDNDNVSFLNAITGKSYWYVYTDTLAKGNSIVLPYGILHSFPLGISDSAAFSGKSVRTTIVLGNAINSPYAGIAINMEPKSASEVDLSAMQSFSFMLKGQGQIRVIFWSRLATTAYADSQVWWGQFGAIEQCPSEWTKTVIRPQDIITPVGSKQRTDSLKWEDAAAGIYKIEFSTWRDTVDTVRISIDQVYLNGVSESVFQ
jgi:hypothetical protein